jgi:molybdopterin synthase catalytic subunit
MPGLSIVLTDRPLDPAAALAQVTHPDAGGIALFLGTTRSEEHPDLGPLLHLEYHAYPEMAEKEMRRLLQLAEAQWPMQAAAIHHRLGVVAVGEASVAIAVSTAHRADAFAACRYLIDELKKTVPIWKKEHYARSAKWQGDAGDGLTA